MTVLTSAFGAYALVRLRFPGRRLLARVLVYTYLVPQSLLFIPLFTILVNTGLSNTRTGLVLTYLGFTVPVLHLAPHGLLPVGAGGAGGGRARGRLQPPRACSSAS